MSRSTTSSTANIFLSGMALCYLWAFMSLYPQIPGLYGPTGILPIHRLHHDHFPKSCLKMTWNDFKQNPSIFCLVNDLKISPIYLMELLCLIGIILSSICMLSHFIRHNLTFIIFILLWFLYLSLYFVGQTFLSFQWDILLLEVGFLTCFVSSSSILSRYNDIIFFCIRWLIFRLMFASFIVKFQSQCPTWWGLTALDWHYESTCIPTPASWYFHNLPNWINHLSVIIMYIIEGIFCILFILPIHFGSKYILRNSRLIAVYSNIFLMIIIQFTGNYNFFNVLTSVIACTGFDDEHIEYIISKIPFSKKCDNESNKLSINKYILWILYLFELIVWIGFIILSVKYFGLTIFKNNNVSNYDGWYGILVNILDEYHINSKVNFSMTDINLAGSKFIMIAVIFGYINIICCIIADFIARFSGFCDLLCCSKNTDNNNKLNCCNMIILFIVFIYRLICYIIKICVGIFIFHISLIPFLNGIDRHHYTKQYVIPENYMNYIRDEWYFKTHHFHLTSSYGLFRRMTGIGGRPELEIFVSGDSDPLLPFNEKYILLPPKQLKNSTFPWDEDDEDDDDDDERGWYRIPFLYKPGDLNDIPGWIAPHQPRLDWQLWFAALGRYQNNPWFISLLYRLITPEQSSAIYDLIDNKKYIYSPYFIANLKRQKLEQEKQEKLSIIQRIGDFIYNAIDNEFNEIDDKDYYKTYKKKRKKNSKKKKNKKNKKNKILESFINYGYPKYITAILYHYHYTKIDMKASNVCSVDRSTTDECMADDNNNINSGIWWTRERKREYFPLFKYNELDSIRDWLKNNGYLNRPIYDGESEMNKITKYIRFIRQYYRRIYHEKYGAHTVIHGLTITILIIRFLHELVQRSGHPLIP